MMANDPLQQSDVSDLAETLGLENAHGSPHAGPR